MESEICTELLRNLIERLGAKFPATTLSKNSVVKAVRLDNAFSDMFELEASPVEGQSLSACYCVRTSRDLFVLPMYKELQPE